MANLRARPKLTPQQGRAIAMRRTSVALSAGAGCGKTFVLTERFLSHLDPAFELEGEQPQRPARLEELIAITFTRRAAGEMRERIRSACHDRLLASGSAEEVEHWLALVRGLQRARISTIDAFCSAFLRSHAVEAGIDPAFRVLDAAQSASLLTEAIDTELRLQLASADESLVALAADFGLARVREMVRELLGGREAIDFDAWLGRTTDDVIRSWEVYRRDVCLPYLVEQFRTATEVQGMIMLLESIDLENSVMCERQKLILAAMCGLTAANLTQSTAQITESARVTGAGVKQELTDLGVYEPVQQSFESVRGIAKEVAKRCAWDLDAARDSAEAGLRLLHVAASADRAYSEAKRDAAALDFRDLVRKSRDLLLEDRHAELRRGLSSDIRLLLVDEFQDTDPVQAELVAALCGDRLTSGRLFFVGDFKQSIYRFRGADPSVFDGLRSKTPEEGRLPLTENFRSQPAILRFVNALFCGPLGPDYEPLIAHRPQVAPEPAVEFLWAAPDKGEEENAAALRKLEADWIARRIRQLLDARAEIVWDDEAALQGKPRARAVRLGDIAILFRALSDVQHYEAALRNYGLDYYLVGGHAFYAQQEVFDLLNLLRALSSPADAVALAGVLRSPFFALDDETLFWLAKNPGGLATGLFEESLHPHLSADQRPRAEFARNVLNELRGARDRLPVAALIERSLARTGYDALLLTEFLGQRKLANLRKLIEQARSFDSSGICTLAEFVTQLDEFVSRQPHEAMAATEAEAADVIRLMSIHQAKGLEFPVVVVPDLQRGGHSRKEVTYSQRLGPLVNLPAELSNAAAMTGRDLYGIVEAEEDRAETERLLYVATTRAADYLLLSSGVKQVGAATSPWLRLLASRFNLQSGRLSAELPDGYGMPRIHVTTARPGLKDRPTVARSRVDLTAVLEQAERLASKSAYTMPASVGPVPIDSAGRRQFSFSELSGALKDSAPNASWELELAGDGEPRTRADAQRLGTLVHALLAELQSRPDVDLPARARHLAELMPKSADAPLSDTKTIEASAVALVQLFRGTDRFKALQGATERHCEIEFLLAWPPTTAAETSTAPATLASATYFRGFIDCLYRDPQSKWHIIDYKTNRVDAAGVPKLVQTYEVQMLLYALAVEQSVGEPPASLVLSFLEPAVEYEIPFSAGARAAAIERIDAALAMFRVGASPAK